MTLSEKKKILVTIDWFLPGYKAGGPIQSCANLITHLKDEYDFWVLTRDTDYCSDEAYPCVQSDTWNQLEENVHIYYFSHQNLSFVSLLKVMRDVRADVAYINGIYSFYFSVLPLLFAKLIPMRQVLVAGRGMLAAGSINVKSQKKKVFFAVAKTLKLYNGIAFHATNAAEQKDIESILGTGITVKVAPNLSKKLTQTEPFIRTKEAGKLKMISIARVAPEKNTKYALEILGAYSGSCEITFDIYGPVYDKAYWEECQMLIDQMPANIIVNYCGSIENNLVSQKLRDYHVLFMPTRGENFGHIILESLTAGCPVLISDKTPWQNLRSAGVGYDVELTDVSGFIGAIEELIQMDTEHLHQLSVNAFTFASEHINDATAIDANRKLFNK